MKATIAAPAKVNLTLHITGKRDDGYHLLDSIVVFTEFSDTLSIVFADDFALTCIGDYGDLISGGGDNIVLRAARQMYALAAKKGGVHVQLRKQIPVGAGLGGGSADAAAMIRFLCGQWGIDTDAQEVRHLAAELGADVPVCLWPKPQRMRGVGEQTQPIEGLLAFYVLLVNPKKLLPTAEVFAAYQHVPTNIPASEQGDMCAAILSGRNDLEPAAISLCPEIAGVIAALGQQEGCYLARMSGSGATCFGLFEDPKQCVLAAQMLRKEKPGWWLTPTRVLS